MRPTGSFDMRNPSISAFIAIVLLMVLADTVLAEHWPADGSPRRIHGTDLVIFIIIALWPVQVGLALMVYYYAGQRGMAARWMWLVLVSIPGIGFIIALAYLPISWREDRKKSSTSEGKTHRIPGHPARTEVRR